MKYNYLLAFYCFFIAQTQVSAQIDHWETVVQADTDWQYLTGEEEPPVNWNEADFAATSWPTGQGGIGYGDGDDNTVISPTESLYMRRQFTIIDKSKVSAIFFHADYDDGFVAYLNGIEIARANVEGSPPTHDTWATGLREARMYDGGLPVAFHLSSEQLEEILQEGQNVLAIQTHNFDGLASSDMTTLYWLSLGINDASNDYGPTPDWFFDGSFSTPLPIVTINTGGEYIPDEPAIEGEMGIIWNDEGSLNSSIDVPNEFFGNIEIERRGQTSLDLFPKNGFAIETKDADWEDMDVSFLGFPEEEDWILHGPYSDKSLIRNVLAMQLARSVGQYASRTRLVELIINEQYEGVYVLMERIKRDNERVDIARLREEDISGDQLTGGYIFKLDKGPIDWFSQFDMVSNPGQKLRFQYVYPSRSSIQPEQEAYIQSYVDSFELAMIFPGIPYGGKYYDEYIDIGSFAEHFLLSELTKNVDAYRISSYYYKDKDSNGGLLKAGPVWDFNLAFGNANYCNSETAHSWVYDEHCGIFNPFWWEQMFTDEAFVNTANCRWQEWRNGPLSLDTIFAFIDEKAELLEPVVDRNFQRWPVLGEYVWPNANISNTYEGEINFLKSFIAARIGWMDDNMLGNCLSSPTSEEGQETNFTLSPNPTRNELFVTLNNLPVGEITISATDLLGRRIWSRQYYADGARAQVFQINTDDWAVRSGLCYLSLEVEGKLPQVRPIVLME